MKEFNNIIRREYRTDRTEMFEESPNIFKNVDDFTDSNMTRISEGEPMVDTVNNRILLKKDGVLNKLALDSNNNIILQEV